MVHDAGRALRSLRLHCSQGLFLNHGEHEGRCTLFAAGLYAGHLTAPPAADPPWAESPKRLLLLQTKSVCHTELALASQTAEDAYEPSFSICTKSGRKFPILCAGAIGYRSLRSCASHKTGNFLPIHCQTAKAVSITDPSRLRGQGDRGVANVFV